MNTATTSSSSSTPSSALPTGMALLHDPLLNKGTAFSDGEREALGLRGLLPPHVCTADEQVQRVLENFRRQTSPLEKYIHLAALHDRNETLFFRIVADNPDETLPIIYTPTVGLACEQFGHIFQRPRGLFVSIEDAGRVEALLRNWPYRDVDMIVVTDGERILGLGDQGANGMGIPVGKLALYTACAGVHPQRCLPVVLDVGTNNPRLRTDPLYIGLARERVRGAAYDALLDEFIAATQKVFPGVVVQFEDFANQNAFRLLAKWRDKICCFNDDIQGTAAVALAGLLTALHITGGALGAQRLLFMGAGEAATGIADLAAAAMVAEGLSPAAARQRSWLFDSTGLVHAGRNDLAEHKKPYAHPAGELRSVATFADAVRALKPTAIIGVAATAGTFTEEVLRAMAAINRRPIVFALSNPTSKSECTAEQAYRFSDGRALFASGSPFDAVDWQGQRFVPRQGNNSYVFPGVGLGAIVARTRHVTDEMFLAAARTLADKVSVADLAQGSLYPPLTQVRDVSAHIAAAVAQVAFHRGLATVPRPADLLAHVRAQMYEPRYRDYARDYAREGAVDEARARDESRPAAH